MTGICGLIGPMDDLQSRANTILTQMSRRGSESRSFSQDIPERKKIIIGMRGSSNLPALDQSNMSIALDGVLFEGDNNPCKGSSSGPERLIQTPGAFSFLIPLQDRLVAGRDILGQKPLYVGNLGDATVAFCSLQSPLVSIGIGQPKPVLPGQLVQISGTGQMTTTDFSLRQPPEESLDENVATTRLEELFVEAIGKTLPRHSGIAFSGGLDSGLVARVARDQGLEPQLISVGLEGRPELEHARETAELLGLPAHVLELSESQVLEALPTVVETTETSDPTIVGISVPIHFACLKARELGLNYIAAGQLSDELFGGYGRFEEIALKDGLGDLSTAMFSSVIAASVNDFDPGDKLAVATGLELCCPFAFLPLTEYALRIPVSLRVRVVGGKVTRKYILRRLAARLKLPQSVVDRPKKAVQYSSGVQRLLLKEAKRRGTSLPRMLESFLR